MSDPFAWSPPPPKGANGLAVLAMILGIFGVVACLTVFLAFVAFVPGVAADRAGWIAAAVPPARRPDRPAPAIVAIVTGIVSTMGAVVAFAVVAIFVASSTRPSSTSRASGRPDDYELSERTCQVDGTVRPSAAGC